LLRRTHPPSTFRVAVTPIGGGLFQYDYTIADGTGELFDLDIPITPGTVITGLTAPGADSPTSPFNSAYDSVLGLASFIQNQRMFTGTPESGFIFDSPTGPRTRFHRESATDSGIGIQTGHTTGPIAFATPEPSSLAMCGITGAALEFWRRESSFPASNSCLFIQERGHKTAIKKSIHRMTSVVGAVALLSGQMFASSHSDAPLSKQDPQTNLTDVYAFIGGNGNLNFITNVQPFGEPGDGVLYDRFADDAMYTINIANPATGALLRSYNFQFSPVSSTAGNYKNKATALSYGRGTTIGAIQDIGDSNQNFTQTYSVTMVDAATGTSTVLGSGLTVPPVNVDLRTTPFYNDPNTGFAISGATTPQSLDKYTMEAVFTAPTGEKCSPASERTASSATSPASSI
jgi:hypothetical protein